MFVQFSYFLLQNGLNKSFILLKNISDLCGSHKYNSRSIKPGAAPFIKVEKNAFTTYFPSV